MAIDEELRRFAGEPAAHALAHVSQLEQEIFDLETRLTEKKTERNTARRAPKRLANYRVKIGADYQCPRCWIESETRSPLIPTKGGDRDTDVLRCRTCGNRFSVSIWC